MPVATGTTFAFSGFTAKITKVSWSGAEIETYDDSDMSTTGWVAMAAKKLAKAGSITLSLKWSSIVVLPLLGASATGTITPPSSARAISGTMIFKKIGPVELTNEEDMTATAEFEFSGIPAVVGSTLTPA